MCATHTFALFSGLTSTCDLYAFELVHMIFLYVRSTVCANVNMGTVIVGCSIALYGRLSLTNDILVSLMYVAGAYF